MALITQADLTNAAADAASLSSFVNGAAGTVTTRLGRVLRNLAQLVADVQAATTVIRAWAHIEINSPGIIINRSSNIASITLNGSQNTLTVTFTSAMPHAYYVVNPNFYPNEGTVRSILIPDMLNQTANSFTITRYFDGAITGFGVSQVVAFSVIC